MRRAFTALRLLRGVRGIASCPCAISSFASTTPRRRQLSRIAATAAATGGGAGRATTSSLAAIGTAAPRCPLLSSLPPSLLPSSSRRPPRSFAAAAAAASSSTSSSSPSPPDGHSSPSPCAPFPAVEVDVRVDGKPLLAEDSDEKSNSLLVEELAAQLELDAAAAASAALRYAASFPPPRQGRQEQRRKKDGQGPEQSDPSPFPQLSLLSLVLCDDAAISALNEEWRGVSGPTDVLSFPQLSLGDEEDEEGGSPFGPSSFPWLASEFSIDDGKEEGGGGGGADDDDDDDGENDEGDEEEGEDDYSSPSLPPPPTMPPLLPPRVLGDLVLSLDTASRQASQRSHSLRDECRVLLVHGALHLLGYDHEEVEAAQRGDQQGESAAAAAMGVGAVDAVDAVDAGAEAAAMAAAERAVLRELGWDGDGLIDAATKASEVGGGSSLSGSSSRTATTTATKENNDDDNKDDGGVGTTNKEKRPLPSPSFSPSRSSRPPRARAVAIDLDGTLLDSSSRACLAGAEAAARALERGVAVVVSTGKARPAARAALDQVGLGELLVGPSSPGVFLQGLAAYGKGGRRVGGNGAFDDDDEIDSCASSFPCLPSSVVRAAFAFASATPGVSAVAFTGDECFTLRVTKDTDELHSVYHEPLPRLPQGGIDELLSAAAAGGGPGGGGRGGGAPSSPSPPSRVLKMLFVADPSDVDSVLKPYWEDLLLGPCSPSSSSPSSSSPSSSSSSSPLLEIPRGAAAPMQAVPNMLELVPKGIDKARGLRHVFRDLGIDPRDAVAVGDGSNDLPMLRLVGTPVAMGNAVAEVKRAAAGNVVASNDERGVAEAIERFVL